MRFGSLLLLPLLVLGGGCASSRGGAFEGRSEACEIVRLGVPARAIVLELRDSGRTVDDDPVVDLVLRVLPVEGEPFDATVRSLVARLDLPLVQPGTWMPVRFDRAEPKRVAIDLWECGSRPSRPAR